MRIGFVALMTVAAVACGGSPPRIDDVGPSNTGDAGGPSAPTDGGFGSGDPQPDAGGGDNGDAGPTANTGGNLGYTVVDLGPASVAAIDNQGRISGATCLASGSPCTGAVYKPGSGWTTAPIPTGADFVMVMGIDQNDILGMNASFSYFRSDYDRVYTTSPLTAMPVSDQPQQTSFMNAMNPVTGHMVGYDGALGTGFFFDRSTVVSIGSKGSEAMGLNSHDQVVGAMVATPNPYNDGPLHGFLWTHGSIDDLGGGLDPSCGSSAIAINDPGVVVGVSVSTTAGATTRCDRVEIIIWDEGSHVIGCPENLSNCEPHALNVQGDIVGEALANVLASPRAFIFHHGSFQWLDQLVEANDWTFDSAMAINDAGAIIGHGRVNSENHAFLLVPH